MDSTGYIALTRQSGLMREMQIVANNIANSATTGYRQEGLVFSEYIQGIQGGPSLSMGHGSVRHTSFVQGTLTQTGGSFDFAIEGDGFFLIQTPDGERATRAGSFSPNAQGDLVTPDGHAVLDAGGAPVFVPPDARSLSVSPDGSISADGQFAGQIGLVQPVDPTTLTREGGVMFRADAGFEPSETARMLQGFVEESNVDPIGQLARMIEIQRAYEMGQNFLNSEDERVRRAMDAMLKSS
ncbi:flagellar hook-basal body complex protein [Tateyamaria sp. ANG-S1]|uniref:flagellar hook-basal body complex protein n=1 Tax=Tateyamaria sp. ANG-S1 TaxID=1577905 RepID=UPI00057F5694|nr:flagellar hook-basal body complex protein [Tateyamaria sp. ANG-S1]KIC49636.1 flagellar basal body rod protein FlgF [Tateyamaria sp. ANG-S1]